MDNSEATSFGDENLMTEITIRLDGRIYVFGLSLEVAEILSAVCPAGHPLLKSLMSLPQSLSQSATHDTTKSPSS